MAECTHHWTVTSECPMCLRARVAELEAEVEHWKSRNKANADRANSLAAANNRQAQLAGDVARLTAERDALRADAERFRWLLDEGHVGPSRELYFRRDRQYSKAEIIQNIDAARAAGEE